MVLDGVRGDDEGLGYLATGEAKGQVGGDLALAGGCAERLQADCCRAPTGGRLEDDRDPAAVRRSGRAEMELLISRCSSTTHASHRRWTSSVPQG